jgi:hypothetical protein
VNITYTPDLDANGNAKTTGTSTAGPVITKSTTNNIMIEHGKNYVINKISNMLFKSYVGEAAAFDSNDQITDTAKSENNKVPFLYKTTAKPDTNMPLRNKFH